MNSVMKQVRDLDYDQVETEHRALLQVWFFVQTVWFKFMIVCSVR